MISVKVNKADPTDLYEQVAAEIRRAIADGEAKPGERLPAAKDLAAILGVNTNTVLRSLRSFGRKDCSSSVGVEASRLRGLPSVVPSSSEHASLSSSLGSTATVWMSSSRSSTTSAEWPYPGAVAHIASLPTRPCPVKLLRVVRTLSEGFKTRSRTRSSLKHAAFAAGCATTAMSRVLSG